MPKILEPNIKVDEIKIQADADNEYGAGLTMYHWGQTIPLVKINQYVCGIGEVISCHVEMIIGQLPKFFITVTDDTFRIREALKSTKEDKCVIFFGFKAFYVKFTGLIEKIDSESGSFYLDLSGKFYHEPLYINKQQVWKDKSVIDILKEVHTETSMGLFTFDNTDLNYTPDIVINPNLTALDFTEQLIHRYTNNVFMYDTFGYLHIGDIDTIRKQPVDKYTIDPTTGKQLEKETEIIYQTRKVIDYPKEDEAAKKEDLKIKVQHYTVATSTRMFIGKKYTVLFDDGTTLELKTDEEIGGIPSKTENTFSGFQKHKFPYLTERVNKVINGCLIKLKCDSILYELTPFTVVNLELWLPASSAPDADDPEKKPKFTSHLDEEHSGKRIVIGYSYDYEKNTQDFASNNVKQNIYLI